MDFGIGFISNNIMLPILDFFYGIVPSYGLAIIALTLVIRFALFPLNAGSIRNMRRMKVTQPLMKKEQEAIKERYKDDPAKQQEEMSKLFQKFGNPLAGCLPLLVQMPVLFALFATLRGSPFANINYDVNLQIFPQEQLEYIQPKVFTTKPQNIYITDGLHEPVIALLPAGNKLVVGEKTRVEFQTVEGQPLNQLIAQHPETDISPTWQIVNGEDRLRILEDGTLEALMPGEVKLQGTLPGIAANKGFLFIDALGRVGAFDDDGTIHWDIVGMILFFGISLYVNQLLSGSGAGSGQAGDQQKAVNQITPVLFSGMFLFFPLPAGVLMYIVVANIFQTIQTFILSREPLPENLQEIVEQQEKEAKRQAAKSGEGREALPFEPKRSKKKASS
ncbi:MULTISPECIES: membrane protein insertase YidC [Moorena]|uniref:YidC/Oxa1 family membrane protein insertase n=1 Tax=Moorena producens 3L TaxID=489825 RepID=F4XWU2_9CYAN|nr:MULTISPECIES: membrane protein insertase YidC [Moorena]NEQ14153.1 membrane protein insertase YidC [Moorena sp. SIO3E2]EGJ30827.1 YidC/Oxa1 family membrane protein insertase [Moorena producens 3L]NEP30265.1 membrane protein insertase YidC [Moorena sp. SIO3B2]NEP69919.1 membrane protein insertase YidC [Moorena sp. SIO3A5]NEQ06235.1 membrane protein insertase YidC [Moorena sp. SIO4E2]